LTDEDLWFWLLTLSVAVIGGGVAALRWLKIARLIEDMPTSRVRSAAQGYVELSGRGNPLPGTRNLAPLTQRPCVWWRYRISRKTESGGKGRRDRWQTIASGTSSLPFLLDDGTGQCIVQPDGAEVVAGESTTWYGDTAFPTAGPGGGLPRFKERHYRYFEERIYEHEQVYALGGFRSTAGSNKTNWPEEVAAQLAQWKQDQPALLARFDRDADGRINLEEWEQARAAARQTVHMERAERPALKVLHLLARPEGDQLFLLAALPSGDLARRYRRRAMLAFGGFVGAVFVLGWLLQDAFG
jgi:hypothetical protein